MPTVREFVTNKIKAFLTRRNFVLVNYNPGGAEHRRTWLRSFECIKASRPSLLIPSEATQILSALSATARIPGDVAEVGVAYGASAKLISQYAQNRRIHLFDTFEGLPELTPSDAGSQQKLKAGEFSCTLESVRSFVGSDHCCFYKGLFPATTATVKDKKFSFVHLDVDLYDSTFAGFQFFYPRMSPGGIIISHDYPTLKGVLKAVGDFFADKPEPVIELAGGYQCMMVKA